MDAKRDLSSWNILDSPDYLFLRCYPEAPEAPTWQGARPKIPAGVFVQYVEEVEEAQRRQVG